MATVANYPREAFEACLSVLMELMMLLGKDREAAVVVGGLVPFLLLGEEGKGHIGTRDIDLALDADRISATAYQTLLVRLRERGYQQLKPEQPFRFERIVKGYSRPIRVEVDFLADSYGGTGKGHRHQRIQGLKARKLTGCYLAFQQARKVLLHAKLPEGGEGEIELQVAGMVPFLVLKGLALNDRLKEKDDYDIYYVLRHSQVTDEELQQQFRPFREQPLVRKALGYLAEHFATIDSIGPFSVARFLQAEGEEQERIQRDAFERVNHFLSLLGAVSGG
jgi:hypothetical protein